MCKEDGARTPRRLERAEERLVTVLALGLGHLPPAA